MIADQLIQELTEKVGLEPVDAHRSAFTALAIANGWTKARIGRWLGISRARVGQKADKLLHYATSRDDVPALRHAMLAQPMAAADRSAPVAYTAADWADLAFARELIARVDVPEAVNH